MPITEGFESSPLGLTWSGNWGWTDSRARTGSWCFTNGDIGDGQTADVVFTVPPRATTLQFWYSVSSEAGYDFFKVIIGGVERLSVSGEIGWTQSAVLNLSGATQVTFRYTKDSSTSAGNDGAYIDDLVFQLQPLTGLSNSFNGGTSGTDLTTGNSGGSSGTAFDKLVGTSRYAATPTRGESGLSVVAATPGADTHVDWASLESPADVFCARMYLYLAAPLSGTVPVFALLGPTGIVSKTWMFADGHCSIYAGNTSPLAVAGTVGAPAGQWVRLEWRYTINSSGNGTAELWLYLDAESADHDEYVTSSTISWPGGGKPYTAEFHLRNYFVDDVAVSPTKIGPAASTVSLRPRRPVGGSTAAHRVASW
ncbi:hypothetical protein AB0K21_22005 [Streptosporangium sp. NPDC049248]|uniref:hypothetical protein n=1 Tax=Streptosporangium sp. NPDC049248 TaxID=3155651 RepID=UPI0034385F0E